MLWLSTLLLISCSVAAQKDSTRYYFNEVGLFINVPSRFQVISAEENKRIQSKGEKAIEEANNIEVNASATTTLISIKEGPFNYLDVTITPYENYTAQGYAKDNKLVKDAMYKTFADRLPASDIDTSSTVVKVNGLSFDVFQVKLKLAPSVTMRMNLLYKYYKGYDLGMSYVYVDESIGKELEAIIQRITFKR